MHFYYYFFSFFSFSFFQLQLTNTIILVPNGPLPFLGVHCQFGGLTVDFCPWTMTRAEVLGLCPHLPRGAGAAARLSEPHARTAAPCAPCSRLSLARCISFLL